MGDDLKDSHYQETQLKVGSMVVIRDSLTRNDFSIFPPINHENLQISSQNCQQQNPASPSSSSSSLVSSSPFDSDESPQPSDTRVIKTGDVTRWISIGLEVLRCKIFALASSFRNHGATNKGAFWSFGPAAALVLFWILNMRARRRRLRTATSVERLMQVIKEKDEKISQLLYQIAQMNEVLLDRHKDLTSKIG